MVTLQPIVAGRLHQVAVRGVLPPALGTQVLPVEAAGVRVAAAAAVGALVQYKVLVEIPVHGRQVLRKIRGELLVVGGRAQLNHGEAVQVQMQGLLAADGVRRLNKAGAVPLNRPADGIYDVFALRVFSL